MRFLRMYSQPRPTGTRRIHRPFVYLPSFAGGGAERVFIRLANYFAASGLQPHFVVNNAAGPLRDALSRAIPVHELGVASTLAAIPRLSGLIRRERPDVILSALTGHNIGAVVARALSRTGIPLVISERNHLSALLKYRSFVRRVVTRKLVRLTYGRADGIIAVADGVADDLAQASGVRLDRIDIVYNPGPDEAEIANARLALVPHPWLIEGGPTIVAVGRLVPQKDYVTLLAALAMVRNWQPEVRLIILGDGPLLPELRKEAHRLGLESAVHFAGFVENRFDYLVNCSLFVLSSDTEGFPNALIEALACGAPVVSTDCAGGGPTAILSASYGEALVPVADPNRLAQAIRDGLGRDRPADLIKAIAGRFSIANIAAQYLAVLAKSTHRARAPDTPQLAIEDPLPQ
jgi:glycosyltransferase involved in cell wall biosynthesis